MTLPPSKTSLVLELMRTEQWTRAISIAANCFRNLPAETRAAIRTGHAARCNPALYRGMGHDPDALFEVGKAALQAYYRGKY